MEVEQIVIQQKVKDGVERIVLGRRNDGSYGGHVQFLVRRGGHETGYNITKVYFQSVESYDELVERAKKFAIGAIEQWKKGWR